MNTHEYNKKIDNTTDKYKTQFPFDNIINKEASTLFNYLDKNDVVPVSIDTSHYYTENTCLSEKAFDSLTDEEKKIRCQKLNENKKFAIPLFGMYEYLLSSMFTYESTRYLASVEVPDLESNGMVSYIFVNTSSGHGSAIGLNLLNQARLREYSGKSDSILKVSGTSLPFTHNQLQAAEGIKGLSSPMIMLLALAFIPAYYVAFLVKEKEVGVKHQQLISGVSLSAYWTSTFLWDIITYIIPYILYYIILFRCIFGIVFMYIFNLSAFKKQIGAVIVVFILYGLAIAPATYFISYFFKNHSTAQNIVLFANILMAIFMTIDFLLVMLESTCRAGAVVEYNII